MEGPREGEGEGGEGRVGRKNQGKAGGLRKIVNPQNIVHTHTVSPTS